MPRTDDAKTPAAPPPDVFRAVFPPAGEDVELKVEVSDLAGVKVYSFAYAGVPVPMPMGAGSGKFYAPRDKPLLLEWVMVGDPGGHMKVKVTRDGETVRERERSTITPPFGEGYDFFRIKVS